jgi:recombination protein RecR
MNDKFRHIVSLFRKLPGVGPRQAARFVLSLMEKSDTELEELGQAISNLHTEISFCNICFNISDNHICSVCADKKRDRKKIMVLEKVTDLDSIEKTGLYAGLYHILGGAINPIDGITSDNLRLRELDKRVKDAAQEYGEIELIVATNPNTSGETTAMFIRDMFENKKKIKITHLARGLASGSHLEYVDEVTLKNALEFRK